MRKIEGRRWRICFYLKQVIHFETNMTSSGGAVYEVMGRKRRRIASIWQKHGTDSIFDDGVFF